MGVEEFRARTTSRNRSLGLLYFYYALVLYNGWLLANLNLARRHCTIPFTEPLITMELLKGVLPPRDFLGLTQRMSNLTTKGGERRKRHIPIWAQSYLMREPWYF